MKVMLLGAGASAATLGPQNAPVSADFGSVLNDKYSDWRDRFPFLSSAIEYLQNQSRIAADWPLDAVWNGIDENYKLEHLIANNEFSWPSPMPARKKLYKYYSDRSWSSFWILAGCELKMALTEVYGTSLQSSMTPSLLTSKPLSKQIKELSHQDLIASMNYDLLLENIAKQYWPYAQNYQTFEELCNQTSEHGPLILKLHGSLDWVFRSNWITHIHRVDRMPDCSPISDADIDLDENFWETRPLVIAPVRYKDEIIFRSAQPSELVNVLNFQWKKFVEAISLTEQLSVFGYRFPLEDSYGNQMLQEAVRRLKPRNVLRLLLYLPNESPDCECSNVQRRLETDIFGVGAIEIECCGRIPY